MSKTNLILPFKTDQFSTKALEGSTMARKLGTTCSENMRKSVEKQEKLAKTQGNMWKTKKNLRTILKLDQRDLAITKVTHFALFLCRSTQHIYQNYELSCRCPFILPFLLYSGGKPNDLLR